MTTQFFDVPLFKAHVALFETFPEFHECCPEGPPADEIGQTNAVAMRWEDGEGVTWFAMVLPNGLELPVVVHECSHLVDFLMDHRGVPPGMKSTEVRALLLEHVFGAVSELLDEREAIVRRAAA